MATASGARGLQHPRSGGKIVRPRRTPLARTPYARPPLLNSPRPNPNWISRFIYSPTRTIATSAGKFLTTVFSNAPSSSSSSSSSSSASDSTADHIDYENDGNDISSQRPDTTERGEPLSTAGKNNAKHLIEQLIVQETFSREECDRLTNIIKSRVVDSPITGYMETATPNRTLGNDEGTRDLCNTAIMEARKWLKDKKSASNSKSHGPCALNSIMQPDGTGDEVGSPVDMAKSYMQTRPLWASPSLDHVENRSLSPIGLQLLKEGTPLSIGNESLSSSKLKRDSPSGSSWNIMEELRKVRSKATEEMLRSRASSKMDWSLLALEQKSSPDSLVVDKSKAVGPENVQSSRKLLDGSSNLSVVPVSQSQEVLQNDASPNPATLISEKNQIEEAAQIAKGTGDKIVGLGQSLQLGDLRAISQSDAAGANVDCLKDVNGAGQWLSTAAVQDSRLPEENCSASKEVAGTGGSLCNANNGIHSSGSSLSAGPGQEQNNRPNADDEDNVACSDHVKVRSAPAEETCELLSEASVEVPIVNENDTINTGTQHSYSMPYDHEGSSQDLNGPNPMHNVTSKSSTETETLKVKRVGRYNRRGRGRSR